MALEFRKLLQRKFPSLEFPKTQFTYQSTIDIDNAYCFLEKGIVRTTASFLRSAIQLDKDAIKERKDVLLGKLPDPYDTFEYQLKLNEKYGIDVVYFVLLGDYGLNDKNCSVYSRKFQLLIIHLGDYAEIGNTPHSLLIKVLIHFPKKKSVWKIFLKRVKFSRQHFLKLEIPKI